MKKLFLASFVLLFALTSTSCRKSGQRGNNGNTRNNSELVDNNKQRNRNSRGNEESSSQISKRSERKMDGPEIFDKYSSAVFMIFTSDGESGFQGSGFFISNDGLAVSNYHVFKGTYTGMEQIKLSDSNVAYKVSEVIAKSDEEDFILFRVNCDNTNYLPIVKSKPKVGEKVYAIGSPRGLENTFSSGEVSQWRDNNLMQISALIDHGSSGGALINEYGEVVGITSGTFADGSQANLNYAWSIDVVKPYIK